MFLSILIIVSNFSMLKYNKHKELSFDYCRKSMLLTQINSEKSLSPEKMLVKISKKCTKQTKKNFENKKNQVAEEIQLNLVLILL